MCRYPGGASEHASPFAGGEADEEDSVRSKLLLESLVQQFWPAAVASLLQGTTKAVRKLSSEQSKVRL